MEWLWLQAQDLSSTSSTTSTTSSASSSPITSSISSTCHSSPPSPPQRRATGWLKPNQPFGALRGGSPDTFSVRSNKDILDWIKIHEDTPKEAHLKEAQAFFGINFGSKYKLHKAVEQLKEKKQTNKAKSS